MSDSIAFHSSQSSAKPTEGAGPTAHHGGGCGALKTGSVPIRPATSGWVRLLLVAIGLIALGAAAPAKSAGPAAKIIAAPPAKQKIVAIDHPKFVTAKDAAFLAPYDRVLGVMVGKVAKAYPLRMLMWHEVVNDVIDGRPIAATYCPWTANGAIYDRVLNGKTLTLSPTGKLYQYNVLLKDNLTHSLWTQINGKALTGADKGKRLPELPSISTTWQVWKAYHPKTLVLSYRASSKINYQVSPYTRDNDPYGVRLVLSHDDNRVGTREMIIGVDVDGHAEAFPFDRLVRTKLPLTTKLRDRDITIYFDPGTATAGATDGTNHIPAYTGFWFGWAAFHPDTEVWGEAPPKPPPPLPIIFKYGGDLIQPREGGTATLLKNGKVLIAGGDQGHSPMLATAELYNPIKHSSVATGKLTHPRGGQRATLLANGDVLLTGGLDDKSTTNTADLYDPTTGRFTAPPPMSTARDKHTATLLKNGEVLITGGFANEGPPMASAELYDPVKNRFVPTGSMTTGRQSHSATLLADGRVLIAGGMGVKGKWLKSAEIYDPATGRFTPTGSMEIARQAQTATLLKNGQVLIAGGTTDKDVPVASTELFDPATGRFSPGPDMNVARQGHNAVLLSNGDVLIVGGAGIDPKNRYLASVELYDPAARHFTLLGQMLLPRFGPTLTLLNDGEVLVTGRFAAPSYFATSTAEVYRPVIKVAQ